MDVVAELGGERLDAVAFAVVERLFLQDLVGFLQIQIFGAQPLELVLFLGDWPVFSPASTRDCTTQRRNV